MSTLSRYICHRWTEILLLPWKQYLTKDLILNKAFSHSHWHYNFLFHSFYSTKLKQIRSYVFELVFLHCVIDNCTRSAQSDIDRETWSWSWSGCWRERWRNQDQEPSYQPASGTWYLLFILFCMLFCISRLQLQLDLEVHCSILLSWDRLSHI